LATQLSQRKRLHMLRLLKEMVGLSHQRRYTLISTVSPSWVAFHAHTRSPRRWPMPKQAGRRCTTLILALPLSFEKSQYKFYVRSNLHRGASTEIVAGDIGLQAARTVTPGERSMEHQTSSLHFWNLNSGGKSPHIALYCEQQLTPPALLCSAAGVGVIIKAAWKMMTTYYSAALL
jgi:hypothetical protein